MGKGSGFDCAGGQAVDDLLLCQQVENQNGQRAEQEGREGQRVIGGVLIFKIVLKQRQRPHVLTGIEHQKGQLEVVPDPQRVHDHHGGHDGLHHGVDNRKERAAHARAVDKGGFVQLLGNAVNVADGQQAAFGQGKDPVQQDQAVTVHGIEVAHQLDLGHHDHGKGNEGAGDEQNVNQPIVLFLEIPGNGIGDQRYKNADAQQRKQRDKQGIEHEVAKIRLVDDLVKIAQIQGRGQAEEIGGHLVRRFQGRDHRDIHGEQDQHHADGQEQVGQCVQDPFAFFHLQSRS